MPETSLEEKSVLLSSHPVFFPSTSEEQDVTFLTGAIIHHAEVGSPGMNHEKGTISQVNFSPLYEPREGHHLAGQFLPSV
jgi:hypothetical protein